VKAKPSRWAAYLISNVSGASPGGLRAMDGWMPRSGLKMQHVANAERREHEKRDPGERSRDARCDVCCVCAPRDCERKKGSTAAAAEKTDTLHNRMFTFHLLDINQHGKLLRFPCALQKPKMENISMRL
jgi:hypothetical protein